MAKLFSSYDTELEPGRAQFCAWLATHVRKLLKLVTFAAAVYCLSSLHLAAATFTASLDRGTITLGESATLSLAVEGGTPNNIQLPQIPELRVVSSGSAQNVTFINGQASSTITYHFTLTPNRVGDYTIPALAVDVAGQKLTSQPLMLKVQPPTAPPPEVTNAATQLAFVKLVLPKQQVYVGETFLVRLELYLSGQVQGASAPQITSFPADGFNPGKALQGQQRGAVLGNATYTVVPYDIPFRAVRPGQLTVGPAIMNLVIQLPSPNRRPDLFESFFGSRGEQRQVTIATSAESIQSLPLPQENVPPGFNGAVGSYTMSCSAGPTNVAAGDPITVRVQITGRGFPESLVLPEQSAWSDFKVLPPTTKYEPADQLGIQGTKTFEQIVTPQNADIKALPPVAFSFFDPDAKVYRTLTHPGVPLVVRPGGSTPVPTVLAAKGSASDSPPPTQGILPNKQRHGSLAQIAPPLAQQPWFLALQGVPVLVFVSALVWRRRAESLAQNPRLRRQRLVAKVIREGLNELRGYAEQNKSEQFFATLTRLLQEQIGERLDLPASAITEAVIEEHLRPRGVPERTLTLLQDLFQTCNLARYAPVKTRQELTALIPKLEAALQDLQALTL
jgi:hypothetical protein